MEEGLLYWRDINLLLINLLLKYADDTDLVVPASHSHTVQVELDGISRWASDNNLTLNVSKSREMIIRGK